MDFIVDTKAGTGSVTPKILVVDDDLLNQRMMQVLLKREGYDVDLASNGVEALEAIKKQNYVLVFMDLQMPVMDGIEASRRIREWENGSRHTFMVALTASYFPENGQTLFEAGIDNYISKPFELEHIQQLLKYSLRSQVIHSNGSEAQNRLSVVEDLDISRGIEQVGGDLETYRELLSDFTGELPERLKVIRRCLDGMDLDGLSRAAHNLHGIAANLGALKLSEYARKLDKESAEGHLDSIQGLVEEIERIGGNLLAISEKEIKAATL